MITNTFCTVSSSPFSFSRQPTLPTDNNTFYDRLVMPISSPRGFLKNPSLVSM